MTIEAIFSLAAIIVALVGLDLYLLCRLLRAKRRDRATAIRPPDPRGRDEPGSTGGYR